MAAISFVQIVNLLSPELGLVIPSSITLSQTASKARPTGAIKTGLSGVLMASLYRI